MTNDYGWSSDVCRMALRECADDLGRSPSVVEYRRWRPAAYPSATAIQGTFGSWNAAKRDVGLTEYESLDPAVGENGA